MEEVEDTLFVEIVIIEIFQNKISIALKVIFSIYFAILLLTLKQVVENLRRDFTNLSLSGEYICIGDIKIDAGYGHNSKQSKNNKF